MLVDIGTEVAQQYISSEPTHRGRPEEARRHRGGITLSTYSYIW